MHISLNEKDKINSFSIEKGVLSIKYGINGRVQGRISAYELSDSKPCVLNLVGSNFSVSVYYKNLMAFFQNEKILVDYMEQAVAAVAETAKANTELAKEHQRVVVERLDAIVAKETEEELRQAVEPYLPEEALKDFKF